MPPFMPHVMPHVRRRLRPLRLLIIAVVLLLLLATFVGAQAQNPAPTATLDPFAVTPAPGGTRIPNELPTEAPFASRVGIEFSVDPTLDFYGRNLFSRLSARLRERGIEVVQEAPESGSINVQFAVVPSQTGESEMDITLRPLTPLRFDLYPLVAPALGTTQMRLTHNVQDLDREDLILRLVEGFSLYSVGDCEGMLETLGVPYNDVLLPYLTNAEQSYVLFYLGNCALQQINTTTAISYYETALRLLPPDLPRETVTFNLAWAYVQNNRRDDANRLLSRLIDPISDFNAKNPLLLYRARFYLVDLNFDDALADLNTVIRSEILAAEAYYLRGIVYTERGSQRDALADFETYLRLDPNGAQAANARAQIDQLWTLLRITATPTPDGSQPTLPPPTALP